jgi:anti-sigma regulatory factor (Ser/Thr protein kinase)
MSAQLAAERIETALPRAAEAPSVARGFLRASASGALRADQVDTASLLVSELVSNAVLHGEGEITLGVSLRPDALRVEVSDQGDAFAPESRGPEARATGGWGLHMVSMLSSRWGISGECARVWFEVDLDGAVAAPNGSAAAPNGSARTASTR